MSGALAQHRPASRPLVSPTGLPVLKFDKHGRPTRRHVLKPGGTYVNGRCVDWQVLEYFATRHVLDYRPQQHRPSKHARGRMRPRTAKEQRRAERLSARAMQASKSMTIDVNRLGAVYDELVGG
jgi:hypothetical protein